MLQQATLFGSVPDKPVSIFEVASSLNVSEATVRNWIKTGYLKLERKNDVSRKSFEYFCKNIAGKEKLTKRANKSLFDQHDHADIISKTQESLNKAKNLSRIGDEYQSALSNTYRNKEGIYYTPNSICDTIFLDVEKPKSKDTFCDPCCGSGNFIMAAIRHGFHPESIYGYDTDPMAVEITKRRIFNETGYVTDKIICADFLDIATTLNGVVPTFDVILTNPPWGKKLPKTEKVKYAKLLGAGRSLDTSSLFFFASLKTLKKGGVLALLLPESFFKIATFQHARRELLRYSLNSFRDFGKPFKGLLTKAQSFCMIKDHRELGDVACILKNETFVRSQKAFLDNPAQIINFESAPSDAQVLSRLFKKPYDTLEGNARWGLGIVTGNNKKFCSSQKADGLMPVYKGVDICKDRVVSPTTFIPVDLSLYQQVTSVEIFEAPEKILYRFISSNLVFHCDRNQSYCLNSVNMIVLSNGFPVSTSSVVKIFNTELFNWAFKKIFDTHKILRADLEKMPIPIEFLIKKDDFEEEELLEYYGIKRGDDGSYRVKE